MRRRLALATLTAGALLAAACSGGDSISDAGDRDTVAPTTTVASDGTTLPGDTTIAPTTTATPLDSLPACDTSALDSVTSPVNITFWGGMGTDPYTTELQKLTDDYNAGQDKVKVNLIGQDSYENVITKYLDSDQGSRPEVAQMPEYMVQNVVDLGSSVPVEQCIKSSGFDTSSFIPGALQAYSTGGVQWSMPFNISDPVLFYNKKVFIAAGLDPDKPPTTLDELREYSQQIVDSGAAKYGIALDSGFDSGGGWFLEQWFAKLGQYYADNDNGRSAKATKVLYDNAEGVDLLTQLQSMINDGLAVSVGDNPGGIDNLLKMADATEPAAMTIASSASIGGVLAVLAGGQFPQIDATDVGVGPMPGPGGPGALVGGASLWIKDGDPAKVAAAWDFVSFLVGAQQQSEWSSITGYIAVRDDARELDPLKTTLANDPRFAVGLDQLLAAPDAPTSAGPVIGPLSEVRKVTAGAVAKIFAGADPQATLSEAAAEANRLIADYNARNP